MFVLNMERRYWIGGNEVSREVWENRVNQRVSESALAGVKLVVEQAVGGMTCPVHGEHADVSLVVIERADHGKSEAQTPDLETNISGCCGAFVEAVEQRMNLSFTQACTPN